MAEKKKPLSDGAVFAYQQFVNCRELDELMRLWEQRGPVAAVYDNEGRADLTLAALSGARAEGYRLAVKNFLTLTETKQHVSTSS